MPKSSKTHLIEDEQKILEILQTNAQASIDDIVKKMRFFTTESLANHKKT